MRKVILGVGLILATSASATDIGRKVEQVDQALKAVGQPQVPCNTCDFVAGASTPPRVHPMEECVKQICGAPNFTLNEVYTAMVGGLFDSQGDYEQTLLPIIREMASINREADAVVLPMAERWLASNSKVSDPAIVRFANLSKGIGRFQQMKFKAAGGEKVEIDEVESRKVLSSLSDAEFQKHLSFARTMLKTVQDGERLPTSAEDLKLFPRAIFEARVLRSFELLQEYKKKVQASPDLKIFTEVPAFLEMFDVEEYRERLLGGEIDPYSLISFNQNLNTARILVLIGTDEAAKAALDGPPIETAELSKNQQVRKYLAKKKQQIASPLTTVTAPNCLSALATAARGLPTEAQLAAFKPRVGELKTAFKKIVSGFSSQESLAKLSPIIDSWEPGLPRTREKAYESIRKNLQHKVTKRKEQAGQLDQLLNSRRRNDYFALMMVGSMGRADDASEVEDIQETCKSMTPNILPDAALPFFGTFSIGPTVVMKSPEYDSISHHEMGHLLEPELSPAKISPKTAGWYAQTKACLAASRGNGQKYQVEDFADLMAARSQSKNSACLFMPTFGSEGFASIGLVNPVDGDTHSSELYRLLAIERLKKGRLPAACEAALAARRESLPAKTCSF